MSEERVNRLKLVESREVLKAERRPARVPKVRVKPTAREVFEVFRKSPGYEEIVARIPKAAKLSGWTKGTEVAYFSVCSKTGAAKYLDIWDCDHFDYFTDMQRSINDCRAWFSHTGYSYWGSAQTATGRVNSYFNASLTADYSCVVSLQAYPSSSTAVVECLIDNNTFGPLTVGPPWTDPSGVLTWPHFTPGLPAGGHSFRIRQTSGSFFFLSLTVYRF